MRGRALINTGSGTGGGLSSGQFDALLLHKLALHRSRPFPLRLGLRSLLLHHLDPLAFAFLLPLILGQLCLPHLLLIGLNHLRLHLQLSHRVGDLLRADRTAGTAATTAHSSAARLTHSAGRSRTHPTRHTATTATCRPTTATASAATAVVSP